MQDSSAETAVHPSDIAVSTARPVTVRYWAAARAAAGREEDQVTDARTVQGVLGAVLALHPGDDRFARVLAISSLLLGDRPVRREGLDQVQVSPGDVVEVLPPFAGG